VRRVRAARQDLRDRQVAARQGIQLRELQPVVGVGAAPDRHRRVEHGGHVAGHRLPGHPGEVGPKSGERERRGQHVGDLLGQLGVERQHERIDRHDKFSSV